MTASAIYLFCTATSAICAVLLLRTHRKTGLRLLFWSGLAFCLFAVNNALVFVDMILLPQTDLSVLRNLVNLVGVGLLLYGLIWDT
ncbi:MAG TPA: DUF5985 family protein [Opitutaceae bacterium]|jgi:hypothetical protein|nr:DUF5985 family protein [Opitutaceae bacterium]